MYFNPPKTTALSVMHADTPEPVAANLRRLLARQGLTVRELAERAGLNLRTVKGILAGESSRPQAKTLHQLARGLEVDANELFQNSATLAERSFDRATNPEVSEFIASRPELFVGWTPAEFAELYSRVGTGGGLTPTGVLAATEAMNTKRGVLQKVALLLESSQAPVLRGMVDVLYESIVLRR